MSRIKSTFNRLSENDEKGFIPFITAGDPDPVTTLKLMHLFDRLGAAVIELGVPFSDPIADGPVIQASSQRALERHNMSVRDVLEIAAEFRKSSEVPVVMFGYLNPFLRYGIDELLRDAKASGVDGFLITDIVDEEFSTLSKVVRSHEMDMISLIAPTTSGARMERILTNSTGFVYAISTTGVTGKTNTQSNEAERLVKTARTITDLPIAVGFGLSDRDDLIEVWKYADAAVVGSAIVRVISESLTADESVERVENYISTLLPD